MSENVTSGYDRAPSDDDRTRYSGVVMLAHHKLVVAQTIDQLLEVHNTSLTLSHAEADFLPPLPSGEAEPRRHVNIRLVPPKELQDTADIVQLDLEIPTRRWSQSSLSLQRSHQGNLEQNMPGYLLDAAQPPSHVPTMEVAGEAYNRRGEKLAFFLSRHQFHAIETKDDIIPAPETASLDDVYYTIPPSPYAEDLQSEMLANWFDLTKLRGMLAINGGYESVHRSSASDQGAA